MNKKEIGGKMPVLGTSYYISLEDSTLMLLRQPQILSGWSAEVTCIEQTVN